MWGQFRCEGGFNHPPKKSPQQKNVWLEPVIFLNATESTSFISGPKLLKEAALCRCELENCPFKAADIAPSSGGAALSSWEMQRYLLWVVRTHLP